MFHQVSFAWNHRFFGHPDQHCFDGIRRRGNVAGFHNHVASAGIHFVFERQRDGQRRERFIQVAVGGDNFFDMRCLLTGHDHHFIAFADDSGRDGSAEAAEVEVRSVDPLDGHPKVQQISV